MEASGMPGEGEGRTACKGAPREPGREAVHVGVGDSEGGGSTSTAPGHGVQKQRPAPGPARRGCS